jgi:hypothetical protein
MCHPVSTPGGAKIKEVFCTFRRYQAARLSKRQLRNVAFSLQLSRWQTIASNCILLPSIDGASNIAHSQSTVWMLAVSWVNWCMSDRYRLVVN